MKRVIIGNGIIKVIDDRAITKWYPDGRLKRLTSKVTIYPPSSHVGVIRTILSDNTDEYKRRELERRGWEIVRGDVDE